jgi:hypothetical protein
LEIIPPLNYETTADQPTRPDALAPSFINKDSAIIWEYIREGDSVYSGNMPKRIGNWTVRATIEETPNYTGAVAYATFQVKRGNNSTVSKLTSFAEKGFTEDTLLRKDLQKYFVAGTSLCGIESTTIQITVLEPDIIIKLGETPQWGDRDSDHFISYEIPFNFKSKPGLDTLIYTLHTSDSPPSYSESNTIIMETPIPFETVVKHKWNNVLFINNNPKTNGGYEFADFEWFKNNTGVSDSQFYSAGPSSKDILNPQDVYKVTMRTKDGMRISTCAGNPPTVEILQPTEKSGIKKQVLGINGKAAKSNAKVYNIHGSQVQETPAGIYFIEE